MILSETIVFAVYLLCMLGIGGWFFIRGRSGGEKGYFLGNRQMGPWITGLSAGASDMSAWVLMGLPTSIYALGLGQSWISIGLALGYTMSWVFEASRLRRFSIVAGDAITIPQYLTNRFLSKSRAVQIICAAVFVAAYTIYAASSMKACGTLFHTVIGIDARTAMYIAAAIIVGYTFLGGFSAVCWTDFFQGMLIFASMLIAPVFAAAHLDGIAAPAAAAAAQTPGYWSLFGSWKDIVSGLGWGLGYFGMPHIIIRFMSLRSQKDMKKSAAIGIIWTLLVVVFAAAIGVVGRMLLGLDETVEREALVFIRMARRIFPGAISGVLLSAVLAASMSTADSQLLSAASSFASDVYKPIVRKNRASDLEMQWASRLVVLAISIVALIIAANPNAGSIMSLVSNAWGVFGAAFGPSIMLSLFWKRFTFSGATAGIIAGAAADILWLVFLSGTGIYEIIPGTICGLLAAVVVSLLSKAPEEDVLALFDRAVAYRE